MSVKRASQGSDTKLGQVGGNTTRFLMVVLRICHSENRWGYGAMFLQRPGFPIGLAAYARATNWSTEPQACLRRRREQDPRAPARGARGPRYATPRRAAAGRRAGCLTGNRPRGSCRAGADRRARDARGSRELRPGRGRARSGSARRRHQPAGDDRGRQRELGPPASGGSSVGAHGGDPLAPAEGTRVERRANGARGRRAPAHLRRDPGPRRRPGRVRHGGPPPRRSGSPVALRGAYSAAMPGATVTEPADLGVLEAAAELRARRLSARELLAAVQARIEALGGDAPTFEGPAEAVNAWARLYPERAEAEARAADERIAREGEATPLLCGVPIGLKDLYSGKDLPLTASSRVLADNVAAEDSAVWTRLAADGMVLVGHTHTHEFAFGGTSDQVGNPWALDRSAGGSSGGSAAALAARMVPAATGTDTAGSLRIPAALSGVSSIKATHGRVPMTGIIPLAASFDHAGPMARSLADCSALLTTMAAGGSDTTPLMPPPAAMGELASTPRPGTRPLEGLRVGVLPPPPDVDLDPDVADGVDFAAAACSRLGAHVIEARRPALASLDDFYLEVGLEPTARALQMRCSAN